MEIRYSFGREFSFVIFKVYYKIGKDTLDESRKKRSV